MKALLAAIFLICILLAHHGAEAATAKSACGPDNIFYGVTTTDAGQPLAAPEPNKALVYVIGQDPVAAQCDETCGIIARVGLDGSWSGAIQGASFLSFNVEPGEHHLCTNWQSVFSSRRKLTALANFTAEAGKVYYFRMRLVTTTDVVMDLDLVTNDEGKYLLGDSRISESHPKKPRRNYADASN